MKFQYALLALLPLGLAACQSTELQKVGDSVVSILQQQNPKKTLTAYDWQLDTGTTKPMVLEFDAEGRFSVLTTCNTLAGDWKVESNELIVGNLISTMMACNEPAMQQENLAGKIFNQKTLPLLIDSQNLNAPTLTLMSGNGQRYVFTGKMTAETRYQGEAETIFLEVSPETKPCTGVVPQTCLQVKEIKYDAQGLKTYHAANWSNFYDAIEGFQHSSTERQVIRVKRFTIKNPAMDQSKYAYVHDMTIERGSIQK